MVFLLSMTLERDRRVTEGSTVAGALFCKAIGNAGREGSRLIQTAATLRQQMISRRLFRKRRDTRCRACFKKRYGSAARNEKATHRRRPKPAK